MSRILAVDPGDRRIGVALSDPTRTLARPLQVLEHTSRAEDAAAIASLAERHGAELILVGLPLDLEGEVGPQARKALRLVEAIRSVADIPVRTWDESGSSQIATQISAGDAPIDARAAAVILQDFLDSDAHP